MRNCNFSINIYIVDASQKKMKIILYYFQRCDRFLRQLAFRTYITSLRLFTIYLLYKISSLVSFNIHSNDIDTVSEFLMRAVLRIDRHFQKCIEYVLSCEYYQLFVSAYYSQLIHYENSIEKTRTAKYWTEECI